jgi:hypothetical protein
MPSSYRNWVQQSIANDVANEPVRKNSYVVELGAARNFELNEVIYLWNAKSVKLPKISFDAGNSPLDGVSFFGDAFQFKDKRLLKFDNVSMTLYNIPDSSGGQGGKMSTSAVLLDLINGARGVTVPDGQEPQIQVAQYSSGIGTYNYGSSGFPIRYIDIKVVNPSDYSIMEVYSLQYPRINSINFGGLDYSSDDLGEIEVDFEFLALRYFQGDREKEDLFLKNYADNVEKRLAYFENNVINNNEIKDLDLVRLGIAPGYETVNVNGEPPRNVIRGARGRELFNPNSSPRFDLQTITQNPFFSKNK